MTDRIYGPAEVAAACRVDGPVVANWRTRGRMPKPDWILTMGPVWRAETIEPFIRAYLARHPLLESRTLENGGGKHGI